MLKLYFQKYFSPALLVLLFLGFLLSYRSVLLPLVHMWSGVEFAGNNHGWLVVACSVYLLYLQKEKLSSLKSMPSIGGWIALLIVAILWLLASITQVQAVQLGLLPLLLISCCWALLGFNALKIVLIPLGLLLFALPVWQPLLPFLQSVTTAVTHYCLKLIGRPVFVEGFYIHVSGGSFVIEEACSGLRFLLVSTTLSLMNSSMNSHNWKQGVKLLFVVWGLSFLANWIRVLVVVLLGDYTRMQHPWVQDHANFGWVLYLVTVLIPFFWLSSREQFSAKPIASGEAESVAVFAQQYGLAQKYLAHALIALTLLSPPVILVAKLSGNQNSTELAELPQQIGNWIRASITMDQRADLGRERQIWQPAYSGYSDIERGNYQDSETNQVIVDVVYYANQKQGMELINVENEITDDANWHVEPVSQSLKEIVSGNATFKIITLNVVNSKQKRMRVWYWYNVGGFVASNNYLAKLSQVAAFLHGREDASLVALSVECAQDCMEQDRILAAFAKELPAGFPEQNSATVNLKK